MRGLPVLVPEARGGAGSTEIPTGSCRRVPAVQGRASAMAAVTVRNIRKSFGDLEVIHGIDLNIEDGSFVVLLGPSGCGKSTLLRMIAGLEPISAGEISIGGRVVNDLHPKDRDIAMVFQNYALYAHMSVFDNMAFSMQLKKMPQAEIKKRVDGAASILDLTPYLGRFPRQLSGGQRQRVAMGRAIVRDPAVFLFDEPLSNLDAELRSRLRGEIKKLHQKLRATVVYVTHDQVEAMTLADRIVILNKGKVEQAGSPTDVYASPANLFVAGFIGSPAMNMLPSQLAGGSIAMAGVSLPLDRLDGMALTPGTKVTFGIRPEDIAVLTPGARAAATVDADVTMVEPLGAEYLLSFALNGHELVAKIVGRTLPNVGDRLRFAFNMEHAHVFDAATGRSLRRGTPTSA